MSGPAGRRPFPVMQGRIIRKQVVLFTFAQSKVNNRLRKGIELIKPLEAVPISACYGRYCSFSTEGI
jgi:hypothetical protein